MIRGDDVKYEESEESRIRVRKLRDKRGGCVRQGSAKEWGVWCPRGNSGGAFLHKDDTPLELALTSNPPKTFRNICRNTGRKGRDFRYTKTKRRKDESVSID